MELREAFPLIAIAVTIAGFLYHISVSNRQTNNKFIEMQGLVTRLVEDVADAEEFMNTVRVQLPMIKLFETWVSTQLPKMLLHDGETERDILLMKLSARNITLVEAVHLKAILDNEFEHAPEKNSVEVLINRLTLLSIDIVLNGVAHD